VTSIRAMTILSYHPRPSCPFMPLILTLSPPLSSRTVKTDCTPKTHPKPHARPTSSHPPAQLAFRHFIVTPLYARFFLLLPSLLPDSTIRTRLTSPATSSDLAARPHRPTLPPLSPTITARRTYYPSVTPEHYDTPYSFSLEKLDMYVNPQVASNRRSTTGSIAEITTLTLFISLVRLHQALSLILDLPYIPCVSPSKSSSLSHYLRSACASP